MITQKEIDGIFFHYDNQDGTIICREHHETWCPHISQITSTNLDSRIIWWKEPDTMYPDEMKLIIPMFPTRNLWAEVDLIRVESAASPRFEVRWNFSPSKNFPVFLCHLSEGEGRNVIRQVLIQYMFSDTERVLECEAAHHSYQQQLRWEADMQSSNMYAQLWSVYTKKECLSCAQNDPLADPSLVPNGAPSIWK